MRHFLKHCTMLAVAGLLVVPSFAAEETGGKKKKEGFAKGVAKAFELPSTITLTTEQQTKFGEVKKEFEPKVREVLKKQSNILTAEQKQIRATTTKSARAAGKKGKELQAEVQAALKLTDEQKKQQEEVGKELKDLHAQIRDKVSEFLTADQKALLKTKKKKAK